MCKLENIDKAAPLLLEENRKKGQVGTCTDCAAQCAYGPANIRGIDVISVGMTNPCKKGYQPINVLRALVVLGPAQPI